MDLNELFEYVSSADFHQTRNTPAFIAQRHKVLDAFMQNIGLKQSFNGLIALQTQIDENCATYGSGIDQIRYVTALFEERLELLEKIAQVLQQKYPTT